MNKRKMLAFMIAIVLILSSLMTSTIVVRKTEAAASSIVASHGMLKVVGNKVCDASGKPIQLKGMSLFWSQWSTPFWNADLVNNLASTWNATLIRAAMGVDEGGYISNPQVEKQKVITVVDAAINAGIYVIIDWHSHDIHTSEAVAFFGEMAQRYKNTPNVIFEIFNEPDYESWAQVKTYSTQVINTIRSTGAQNLILVGSPTWSQDVDVAANDPITGFSNIAYTLHFYAGTHKQYLRDKAITAMSKGLALFVSEWGTCDASGNGNLDLTESQRWIDFMNQYQISWANWSMNDKAETASALVVGASTTGPWPDSQLTESGKFVKAKIMENTPVPPSGGTTPPGEYTGIGLPFTHDGAGEYYWKTNKLSTDPNDWSHYINSWNLDLLEINGKDYTNVWVAQHQIAPSSDGYWYIHYKGSASSAHMEMK
ncbi:cellulase family glycosylhydrolase [Mahella australiensis]|uniref:cellulase n=1 Tax=Mahella australiensis (strain DSM 15567 / CIP 107919 / 50-1 BON) TaxID=697281 RepID=F4A377_MAHA5|nr:cellulase family glycosylhydrolase [Mahella australiensis]AEE96310.1 Cellulase [Mahella australiensis 50-1 BON]